MPRPKKIADPVAPALTSATSRSTSAKSRKARKRRGPRPGAPKYPRHSLERALRAPQAIQLQNAGRACTDREAAGYLGIGTTGDFRSELASAIKFGLLERPAVGKVQVTDLAKKILKPQQPRDESDGLREAALKAPEIAAVYSHY